MTISTEPSISYRDIESAAVGWARELGEIARLTSRDTLGLEYKGKNRRDPVTAVDKAIEARMSEHVAERFPGHALLGEETVAQLDDTPAPEYVWIVDPIDGTANFASGMPCWAVSIGVFHNRRPVAAAVYSPMGLVSGPSVYHAYLGGGAFCDDTPLKVPQIDRPEPALIIGTPSNWQLAFKLGGDLAKGAGEPRVFGSIAVEYALTAAGVLQYSYYNGPKIWDVAAGVLLVSEAGGVTLSRSGKVWSKLDQFTVGRQSDAVPSLKALAEWRAPLIAGAPGLAAYVSEQLHRRFVLRYFMFSMRNKLKRRMKRS
jgi:myo-inositol-1(or 4)-monophosphatase